MLRKVEKVQVQKINKEDQKENKMIAFGQDKRDQR